MPSASSARRESVWPEYDSVAQAQYSSGFGSNVFAPLPAAALTLWRRHRQLAGLRLVSCGYYGRAAGHSWERAGLAETVLLYCVAGRGSYREGGRAWRVEAGDVLYCPPRSRHRYAADAHDPWSIYWIHLAGPAVAPFMRSLGVSRTVPIVHVGLRPEVTALFDELFALRQIEYRVEHLLALQACAQLLLARLALAQRFSPALRGQARSLNEIIELMQGDLPEGFSLAALAKRFGASPAHFLRVFRRQTGETPLRYYRRMQIRRACQLLADSRLRIKEVAARVGFADPYHFSRLFLQIAGASPRAWRAMLLSDHPGHARLPAPPPDPSRAQQASG
ncbi:MAG: AraC family transcriptional regulator [Opitutae bacterium]|nr:AraC family transcriptional regulator [Opitutae bacterium]